MTLCIYSAGGYARELKRLVIERYPAEDVILVDDAPEGGAITYEQALSIAKNNTVHFCIAFANAALRRKKTAQVLKDGFPLFWLFAKTSIVGSNVKLGAGTIMSDFSMITADARIGDGFHCNIYSYVAHDCVVGDYVTLAPRVSVNGRVVIEDDVYIGTGATILPGKKGAPITIGRGAVVGAHALVTKDVPAGAVVVGSPAKILRES